MTKTSLAGIAHPHWLLFHLACHLCMNATGAMTAKEEEKENKERQSRDKQWPDYIALVSMVTKGCHIAALIKGLMNCRNWKTVKTKLREVRLFISLNHIYNYQCSGIIYGLMRSRKHSYQLIIL